MNKIRYWIILFAVLIILIVLFVRCDKEDMTLHPVTIPDGVASVSITRSAGGTKMEPTRQYMDPQKVQKIIEYLITVELKGAPLNYKKFPTGWHSDGITLYTADGSVAGGYSICSFAFRRNEGDWYSIDYPEYEYFSSLVDELEPDNPIEN